jgi:hypothetical protein
VDICADDVLFSSAVRRRLDELMPRRPARPVRADDGGPVTRGELRKALRTVRRALKTQDADTAAAISALLNRTGGAK